MNDEFIRNENEIESTVCCALIADTISFSFETGRRVAEDVCQNYNFMLFIVRQRQVDFMCDSGLIHWKSRVQFA